MTANTTTSNCRATDDVAKDCGNRGSPFLNHVEAAEYLRISPRTLERHRLAGTGPRFCAAGRRRIYRISELEAWTEARTFSSTAEVDAAEVEQ